MTAPPASPKPHPLCPHCDGKGWYVVVRPRMSDGEPEQMQEQCQCSAADAATRLTGPEVEQLLADGVTVTAAPAPVGPDAEANTVNAAATRLARGQGTPADHIKVFGDPRESVFQAVAQEIRATDFDDLDRAAILEASEYTTLSKFGWQTYGAAYLAGKRAAAARMAELAQTVEHWKYCHGVTADALVKAEAAAAASAEDAGRYRYMRDHDMTNEYHDHIDALLNGGPLDLTESIDAAIAQEPRG